MASQQILTFVFSDIEHSTQLAQQLREDYPEYLERHRSVIRGAIQKYGGQEIDTAGDGFFMIFQNPQSAVAAVTSIQTEFHTLDWATRVGLQVRMSIHTGEALPTKSGYSGVEIHRASRICKAAFGGQVLVSEATKKILEHSFHNRFSFLGLGEYLLKDFEEPVELFQLNIPGIRSEFPETRINPGEKRIAVLPFTNLGKDLEQEYIGDGIAEEIIIALGKLRGLRVVSRSSAFALKNGDLDAKKLGKQLNVSSVLEGRVNVIDGAMRISVELIDTQSGLDIWSAQYDRAKYHLQYVQEDIIQKIKDALDCGPEPQQLNPILKRQTLNAEAYDYYLRGRRFYMQFSGRGVDLALQMFAKAIEADSTYALAYAGVADCYSYQFQHISRSGAIIDKADEASKKAIELAPALADGYVSRGIVMGLRQQFDEAEHLFQYAIERDPNLFLAWFHYGRTCFAVGKLDKAARLFEQANRVDPDDYQSIFLSAQSYNDLGITDLAYTLRKRGVAIAEKYLEINPGDTRALYLSANALVFLGQRERSISLLQRALSLEPGDSMLLYNAGCIYALLQMKPEALSCLEAAYKAGLTLGGWYENDSNLDSLRDEPRFVKLLEQLKNYSV